MTTSSTMRPARPRWGEIQGSSLYDDVLPTMTLFQWRALGRPVHGVKKVS